MVEYALSGMDNQLFVSTYMLHLPDKKKLQEFILKEIEDVTNMKETEKRKETSNKPDDRKKKKQKWFIIIICFVLIAGVAEFGYLSSQSKKKEEAQKTAFDNVAVEVKDDYAETIPLTSEEKIVKTEDLVEILKDGKGIE